MFEHGFGRVLSTGEELRHRFRLTNPTDCPLRLVNPTAYTPCCSAIGPVPESIPAGGEVEVPVAFRTRGQKGPGRLMFSVESAGPERIIWQLSTTADLRPAWEVVPEDDGSIRLPVGRAGEARVRIICRRQHGHGLDMPDRVEGIGGLAAAFAGPIRKNGDPDNLIAHDRPVRISLLASPEPGFREGIIRFHWPDGSNRDHQVGWEVVSLLSVTPKAVILPTSTPGTIS